MLKLISQGAFGCVFHPGLDCNDSIENKEFSAYLRLEVVDRPGVLSNITKIFSKNKVSIKRLIQNPINSKKYSSIIIITHQSKNKFLNKVIRQVEKKVYIKKKPKLIRIVSY